MIIIKKRNNTYSNNDNTNKRGIINSSYNHYKNDEYDDNKSNNDNDLKKWHLYRNNITKILINFLVSPAWISQRAVAQESSCLPVETAHLVLWAPTGMRVCPECVCPALMVTLLLGQPVSHRVTVPYVRGLSLACEGSCCAIVYSFSQSESVKYLALFLDFSVGLRKPAQKCG